MSRNFRELLEARWGEGKFLCVGLDSDLEKIPEAVRKEDTRTTIVAFNRAIVDATYDLTCAFKLNPAFYEAHGDEGWSALRETIAYILDSVPKVPVILDAKRGDIANTNKSYAIAAFEHLRADAVTVSPFLGGEPLLPFFAHKDKGVIVLCHTSNPGAKEIQGLAVDGGGPLYKFIARSAAEQWNTNGNCCLMVGATYPGGTRGGAGNSGRSAHPRRGHRRTGRPPREDRPWGIGLQRARAYHERITLHNLCLTR